VKFFDVGVEAYGWIAIGQHATGFIAIGQLALGVVAIGQLARGLVAFGQVCVGGVAIGQVGVGLAYGAGMIGLGGTAGGMVPLAAFGRIPLRQVFTGSMSDVDIAWTVRPWKVLVMLVVAAIVVPVTLIPLWERVLAGA
jgi:hypothetical protein